MVAPSDVVDMVESRTAEICHALARLDERGLEGPTALAGWSRLTIACHLRYGAQASQQITEAALVGRPASFYPGGRDIQRPETLHPALGEAAHHVVVSLRDESAALADTWRALGPAAWSDEVVEQPEDHDLGALRLDDLARLRLTEVTVHGTDLALGLAPWPSAFGVAVLGLRLRRARVRSQVDAMAIGFDTSDAGAYALRLHTDGTTVVEEGLQNVEAAFAGTANEVVAFLLGRASADALGWRGDRGALASFADALEGP